MLTSRCIQIVKPQSSPPDTYLTLNDSDTTALHLSASRQTWPWMTLTPQLFTFQHPERPDTEWLWHHSSSPFTIQTDLILNDSETTALHHSASRKTSSWMTLTPQLFTSQPLDKPDINWLRNHSFTQFTPRQTWPWITWAPQFFTSQHPERPDPEWLWHHSSSPLNLQTYQIVNHSDTMGEFDWIARSSPGCPRGPDLYLIHYSGCHRVPWARLSLSSPGSNKVGLLFSLVSCIYWGTRSNERDIPGCPDWKWIKSTHSSSPLIL